MSRARAASHRPGGFEFRTGWFCAVRQATKTLHCYGTAERYCSAVDFERVPTPTGEVGRAPASVDSLTRKVPSGPGLTLYGGPVSS